MTATMTIERPLVAKPYSYVYSSPWQNKFPYMIGFRYPNIGNNFHAVQQHGTGFARDVREQAKGEIHVEYDGDLFRGGVNSIMRTSQVLIHLTEVDRQLFLILKLSS